ncbi:MAG TPA: Rrf2 family transcriptional regulator [Nitrospinota bacterium]|nr:Rrf2 family transcriptional regulator [Nitrospinota bacterium]
MWLTTRGRYAARAMIDLACHSKGRPVSLQPISERQNISLYYLGQLFMNLRKAGLVKGMRGPSGGYVLTRRPADISIMDIFSAVEEGIYPVNCIRENIDTNKICDRQDGCVTRLVWKKLYEQTSKLLATTTLKDACKELDNLKKKKTKTLR